MDLLPLALTDLPAAPGLARVPDTIWSALVAAVITLALALRLLPRQADAPAPAPEDAAACDFLLSGASVRPLTAPARAMVAGLGGGAPLQGLARHLARDCPTIQDDLEALILFGEGFRRHCTRPDGSSYEVAGRPQGPAALLSIRPASPESRALDAAERALARARDDMAFQREALDRAPILVWTLGPDGAVIWANAGYRDRFDAPAEDRLEHRLEHRIPDVFAHVLEEVPLTARDGCDSRRRLKIADPHGGDPHWYEVSRVPLASGGALAYAVEVDDLVAAEASLRRFVETLTETFAHLPIGLAVFDKNRRLGLFNPALSDLVKIDAVWLAGRPSLRDFLERLRETRQMPEQKDFAAFRRMLTELEEGAREGTYEENWQLPSGKIFRVTGRPHPQGALAFLFEDISPTIQLERRYRSELELSQATLDRIGEAVAVFDTSGMLVFANAAFERLWSLDPMERLEGPGVGELVEVWSGRCAPSPVWAEVAAFATGAERRTSWSAPVETRDGRPLELQIAPLPNGSTLVTFRDRRDVAAPGAAGRDGAGEDAAGQGAPLRALPAPAAAAPASDPGAAEAALLADLALAELELPAEAALASLAAAVGAAPDRDAFAALSASAQALKDGLARARALQAEAGAVLAGAAAPPADDGLAGRLARLIAPRGFAVAAPPPAEPACLPADEAARLGRALGPLAFALAGLATPGATVELAVSAAPPAVALRAAAVPAADAGRGAAASEPPGLALARRRLAALGATLEIAREPGRVALAARFPAPRALAAPGPRDAAPPKRAASAG